MFVIFTQGFLLQASLILALGAQNIFVLNSGLRREKHLLVATVCSLCDAILIFLGVLGVATVFVQVPILKIGLGVIGVLFLFFYGLMKLNEARKGISLTKVSDQKLTIKQTIMMTLGFSLLNPHVYLDTVVLIGGYSSKFNELIDRFYFGLGAMSFSTLWFFGLAILASAGSRILNNEIRMRGISLVSGLILILLAFKLGQDVLSWI